MKKLIFALTITTTVFGSKFPRKARMAKPAPGFFEKHWGKLALGGVATVGLLAILKTLHDSQQENKKLAEQLKKNQQQENQQRNKQLPQQQQEYGQLQQDILHIAQKELKKKQVEEELAKQQAANKAYEETKQKMDEISKAFEAEKIKQKEEALNLKKTTEAKKKLAQMAGSFTSKAVATPLRQAAAAKHAGPAMKEFNQLAAFIENQLEQSVKDHVEQLPEFVLERLYKYYVRWDNKMYLSSSPAEIANYPLLHFVTLDYARIQLLTNKTKETLSEKLSKYFAYLFDDFSLIPDARMIQHSANEILKQQYNAQIGAAFNPDTYQEIVTFWQTLILNHGQAFADYFILVTLLLLYQGLESVEKDQYDLKKCLTALGDAVFDYVDIDVKALQDNIVKIQKLAGNAMQTIKFNKEYETESQKAAINAIINAIFVKNPISKEEYNSLKNVFDSQVQKANYYSSKKNIIDLLAFWAEKFPQNTIFKKELDRLQPKNPDQIPV